MLLCSALWSLVLGTSSSMADKLIHNLLFLSLLMLSIFLFPPLKLFTFLFFLFKSANKENVAGKDVLITGASSGIGEQIAYQYARKGACLVLVARRENLLQIVAEKARRIGSPDVIVVRADVSVYHDCKRFVDKTISHFGRLDHLVNNAGVAEAMFFEEYKGEADLVSVMNVNFWGSVYTTQFAVPHLRSSKGKVIVIASSVGYVPAPILSIYSATKAAVINFFEAMRMELAPQIRVTIVTPGVVETELTNKKIMAKMVFEKLPRISSENCASAVVKGVVRGDRYVTAPAWIALFYPWWFSCSELFEWGGTFLSAWKKKSFFQPGDQATSNSLKSD